MTVLVKRNMMVKDLMNVILKLIIAIDIKIVCFIIAIDIKIVCLMNVCLFEIKKGLCFVNVRL